LARGGDVDLHRRQSDGEAGALAELAAHPYGPWLLGAVAIGLVAYGIYSLVEARYGQMTVRH